MEGRKEMEKGPIIARRKRYLRANKVVRQDEDENIGLFLFFFEFSLEELH